ncbi:MAG: hypothetical protein H6618_08095, partial [Deltaproteobacteria bacterium]|nr:hypothetical protein [Deltaproteobacteria bacterium]
EVTDLSLSYHVCLATGFAILAYTAYVEDSVIFMTKQIMTTIPVMILISQILYFEHFYEQGNEIITDHSCLNCKTHIEIDWNYCSLCGFATETAFRQQSATLASTASSPPPSCAAS